MRLAWPTVKFGQQLSTKTDGQGQGWDLLLGRRGSPLVQGGDVYDEPAGSCPGDRYLRFFYAFSR